MKIKLQIQNKLNGLFEKQKYFKDLSEVYMNKYLEELRVNGENDNKIKYSYADTEVRHIEIQIRELKWVLNQE